MVAVWIRAAHELRTRWRAWLAISLMVGFAGGVVMAAAAGARRTSTAVDRFLAYTGATNADVEADPSQFRQIAALPEVQVAGAGAYMLMGRSLATQVQNQVPVSVIAIADPLLRPRPFVVAGRMFDWRKAGEAIINESALRTGALRLGESVRLQGYSFDQMDEVLRGSEAAPLGPSATVTIVGVIRMPTDLSTTRPPPGVIYTGSSDLLLTPALYAQIGSRTANFLGLSVRLKRGNADMAAFIKDVARVTGGRGVVHQGSDDLQAGAEAQRATHTEAQALWIFAALAALAALLIVGQSISRQLFVGSADNDTLIALGMSRGQLTGAALLDVAIACAVGTAVAVAIEALLSPLTPIGLAREADVDVGFHLDATVVSLGVVAVFALFLLRAVLPAWHAGRGGYGVDRRRGPSRAAVVFARGGMPAPTVAGVQMALDPGRGRTAVPVQTAIAGSVLAVAVLIAAVSFGASLARLAGTPRLQGWRWDFAVGNPHSDDVSARAIPLLEKNPYVGAFSAEEFDYVTVDHHLTDTLGLLQVKGSVGPEVLEGRSPQGPDEIALGSKVLRRLKKSIGDHVTVGGPRATASMKIVGRVLITPTILNGQVTLGDGAWMQQEALRRFVAPSTGEEGAVNVFLVKVAAGADGRAAAASLQRDFPGTVLTSYPPAEVENLRRIGSIPFVLAGLLALLAVATIAHALVTSVRRRRRDLAILKTLGFVRGQLRATVAWQASTLTLIATVIGLVAGAVGGRWLWTFYAGRLGIRPEPVLPLLLLILIVPAALFLANAIGALPAQEAACTNVARALRAE